jgi:hypothetical protein
MLSTAVSIIYLLIRFIEMRFITKETKPLKTLIRDALLVYISSLSGFYILQNITPVVQANISTTAFTNDPDF